MSHPAFLRVAGMATALLMVAAPASAFQFIINGGLPDGDIVLQINLGKPGSPLDDGATEWSAVIDSVCNEWNQQLGRSKFKPVANSTAEIGARNQVNNVAFRSDIYGEQFDSSTLAVTLTYSRGGVLEKDVLFNANRIWNSYRGSVRSNPIDLRRVALHEFGHVLGLDHPDATNSRLTDPNSTVQSVSAVMNSRVSSVETLRADDIAGAKALYGSSVTRAMSVNDAFTLSVPTNGSGLFTYAWYFRGANSPNMERFPLGTGESYTIGAVQPADAGTYVVTAQNGTAFFSNTVVLGVSPVSVTADSSLANISTRGLVGTGSNVMIAGFVVGGTTAKSVLVRAAGPALADFGVAGALSDPTLKILNAQNQVVAENDNWETAGDRAAIIATSTRLGAFQFKAGSRDAAVLASLPPGSYTAIVSGVSDTTGVALVETYDADPDAATSRTRRLVNIATRGQVSTGENVLIAGLVVTGPGPRTYLVRAVGPSLSRAFNIASALRDPFLQIYQGSRLLHENDDWDTPSTAQPPLREAATRSGAFALAGRVNGTADSALIITLQPGSYTAKVSGYDGGTGIALIEVYELP